VAAAVEADTDGVVGGVRVVGGAPIPPGKHVEH
jgi:hypothetical protein